jgi:beta-glucosidase
LPFHLPFKDFHATCYSYAAFLQRCRSWSERRQVQAKIEQRHVPLLAVDGLQFKDLNRNGKLDPYEDWRLSPEIRAHDLVTRMSLEDLAGLMVCGVLPSAGGDPIGRGTAYDIEKATTLISGKRVNSFMTRLTPAPAAFAIENNRIQEIAEGSDFGVPVLISTDPRSHFASIPGSSVGNDSFSKWPETLGLAAIGSPELTRNFADIVRQEYSSVGMREAVSPQADLATEPRWGRIVGTFGEDAETSKRMVEAYVSGMQNGASGLNTGSVASVVKHWVGYGAQHDGGDSHNYYGRFATFPGNNFNYHVIPFTGAFDAHVASVMPTYSILEGVSINGQPLEQIGGGFNKQLISDLLRDTYKFNGVVLSDFSITNDCTGTCLTGVAPGEMPDFTNISMPWGVEAMSREQRFAKGINAGIDQIGGTDEANFILAAVHDGLLTRSRIEQSGIRVLLQKFQMGLFEDPYVDPSHAASTVGRADFVKQGQKAQERSSVLLENKHQLLPLKAGGRKVYLFGVNPEIARRFGFIVVGSPAEADLAIVRADAPSEMLHPGYTFGFLHEGRLDFRPGDPAYDALMKAGSSIPVVFAVFLDRPAILTNIKDKASAILANFGISDEGLLDVITGQTPPDGHLPFELPSSMAEVTAQKGDVPYDTVHPLYSYGFGLKYGLAAAH